MAGKSVSDQLQLAVAMVTHSFRHFVEAEVFGFFGQELYGFTPRHRLARFQQPGLRVFVIQFP
jgi:hypothetical protein